MPLKDLPGYYPEIKDGGLGVLPPSLAGLFGVVGNSISGSTEILFAVDPDDVEEEYGFGTLVERTLDAFASGASQLGIVRAVADTAGSMSSSIEHLIYGPPAGEDCIGGKATAAPGYVSPYTAPGSTRRFRILIVKSGSFDEATYKLSLNGGKTWGAENKFRVTDDTAPRKALLDMGNGTSIEFTEHTTKSESFAAGDEYRWETKEPTSSLDEIIAACERAAAWKDPNTGYGLEYVLVAGLPATVWSSRTKDNVTAFWAALATIAEETWSQEYRPIWFICEAPPMSQDFSGTYETTATWISLLNSCSADYRNRRLCVVGGFSMQVDSRGEQHVRSIAGSAAGLVSKAKLHHSIGWVREMAIPNSIAVYPYKPLMTGTYTDSGLAISGRFADRPLVPWSITITADSVPLKDGGDGVLYNAAGDEKGTIDYDSGAYTLITKPTVACTATYTYVTNDEMDKGNLALLNDGRFITLRPWIGYGRVPTDDWMMAPPTSDYFCIRNRRIIDEAVRMVGIANVPYVNSPGISEKDMAAYKADLSRPLEAMKITEEDTDKPIINYKLTLTPDANIWSNGIVHCKVEIVPTPTKKKLEATFQLKTNVDKG